MRLAFTITAALAFLTAMPAAGEDIATGQILFNQRCSICHSLTRQSQKSMYVPLQKAEDMLNDPVDPGKPSAVRQKTTISALRQGPDLSGLLQRKPGGLTDYAYVEDYTAYGDEWNKPRLDAWIIKHDDGRTDAESRVDIIGYLSTLRNQ